MNNLPLALQIASQATSLDKVKVTTVDRSMFSKYNGSVTRVRTWFPGLTGEKIARKCAQSLNDHIDGAKENYGSTEILIGCLAMPIKHNLLYADIDMEYLFQ